MSKTKLDFLLTHPSAWRTELGLLPVPLRRLQEPIDRYILLNGGVGNFCLDISKDDLDGQMRCSHAWSSNVGHYVRFTRQFVEVHRWDMPERSERYTAESVTNNIEGFHRYLESNNPSPENSVVQHSLVAFRTLRNLFRDDVEGFQSIRAFLYLLASAAVARNQRDLNIEEWGLNATAAALTASIRESEWEELYARMIGLGAYRGLTPDYTLVLRHVAGTLFQEAHYQAQLSHQGWLFGVGPAALPTTQSTPGFEGIFFTPQPIARTLAEDAVSHLDLSQPSLTIFDPACGSSELLKEVLRILELRDYGGTIRLIGWDVSPAAVDMGRFALMWEAKSWPAQRVTVEVVEKNSLTSSWPSSVDLIIMNPPFKAWQQMDAQEQEITSRLLEEVLFNRPNTAAVFANLAADNVREGGVLAMVAPSSFFEGESTKKLRGKIAGRFSPRLIAKLGDQSVFHNALVDAGLYVGHKLIDPTISVSTTVVWADHRSNSLSLALRALRRRGENPAPPMRDIGFSVYLNPSMGKNDDPWAARPYDAWLHYHRISNSSKAIMAGKLYDIRQGCRLGHDIFIVTKDFVSQLQETEKAYFRPAVVNASILHGRLNDTFYIFYPYTQGLPIIDSETMLSQTVPVYYREKLLPVKRALQERKSLLAPWTHWWDLSKPREWQREPTPKLVSTYFGHAGSFSWDRIGEYVVVVGYAWIPRKTTWTTAEFALLAYLNSPMIDDILPYISIHISGGQWNLSKKYLAHLPIPNPDKAHVPYFSALAKLGEDIVAGKEVNAIELQELCGLVFAEGEVNE